jgi:PD-(D/E)XK endonuclease
MGLSSHTSPKIIAICSGFLSGGARMMAGMDVVWTPRRQGDAGELSAMTWLTLAGALVSKPLFENSDYDLIADFGARLVRVQVKTSTCWVKNRFVVALCTRGGNQSWNGIVKHLDATRCDCVFVHVGDGRRWYIPATALGGGSSIRLGGPRYAEYEVEPGEPLQARPPPVS